jgi:hypothetical protein
MKKQQLYVYSNYLLSEIWRCILKKIYKLSKYHGNPEIQKFLQNTEVQRFLKKIANYKQHDNFSY